MDAREKEQYLREYSILKNQGKPFFPYAIAKDSMMAIVTLAVIILMAILFGAELGPKADPTTTTYTPRPEWYFFFLFELLRVVKPPELVFVATIGIPTVCLVLLLVLPFIDRGPERRPLRRPIAMTAGLATIAAMAYLTVLGALAGSPTEIEQKAPPGTGGGPGGDRLVGLPRLPQDRRERQHARPEPHDGRRAARQGRDRPHAHQPHSSDAAVRADAAGEPRAVRPARRVRRLAQGRVSGSPASGTLADTQVRAMFDRIARVYDRMNSVMTAGMHHRWRERAADLANVGPGSTALDVATGTGDLAIELARRGAEVTGMDFAPAMLEIARKKAPGLSFEEGDALQLAHPDGSFDAATVGFGARNFADLDRGLAEMARVTKPGGRVVVLEITTPQKPPLSWFFRAWFDRVVPALGRLAGDPDAYTYLPSSVRRFPGPEELGARMASAGLVDVRWILTAGGIIAIHVGTKR